MDRIGSMITPAVLPITIRYVEYAVNVLVRAGSVCIVSPRIRTEVCLAEARTEVIAPQVTASGVDEQAEILWRASKADVRSVVSDLYTGQRPPQNSDTDQR